MSTSGVEGIICRRCSALLDAGDNYCRRCGAATAGEPVLAQVAGPAAAPPAPGWSENPGLIVAMLFLVLGPIALPMLWRSRQITLAWKIVLTVLVLALTGVIVGLIWRLYYVSLAPLRQLLAPH
jgi:hypothetical protein